MSSMYEKFSPTHPDLYSAESGITYEPIGPVTEGMPYKAKVYYKVDGEIISTKTPDATVFPDNWDAEKIIKEVERLVPEHLLKQPGNHPFRGKVSSDDFYIEGSINVKANGKAKIATAYLIVK